VYRFSIVDSIHISEINPSIYSKILYVVRAALNRRTYNRLGFFSRIGSKAIIGSLG